MSKREVLGQTPRFENLVAQAAAYLSHNTARGVHVLIIDQTFEETVVPIGDELILKQAGYTGPRASQYNETISCGCKLVQVGGDHQLLNFTALKLTVALKISFDDRVFQIGTPVFGYE